MSCPEKPLIRAEVRLRLAEMDVLARAEASANAVALLMSQPLWQNARCILAYLPLADELDISPAVEAALHSGKTVALPRFNPAAGRYEPAEYKGETLERKKHGVREPDSAAPEVPLNRLDLLLVPGVAFDWSGRRLGRGLGYYDRLLAGVTGMKCGVAMDEQMIQVLPSEPHDIAMDLIVTPTRWADLSARGH